MHSLKDCPHVIDIRNIGLIGGIELEPLAGQPSERAFEAFLEVLRSRRLIRVTGDIIALSPPLIIEKAADRPDLHDHPRGAGDYRVGCKRKLVGPWPSLQGS